MKPWRVTATSEEQTDRIQFSLLRSQLRRPAALNGACRRTGIPQINGVRNGNYRFCFGRKMRYVRRNSANWTLQTDNISTVPTNSDYRSLQTDNISTVPTNSDHRSLRTDNISTVPTNSDHRSLQTDNISTIPTASLNKQGTAAMSVHPTGV